MRREDTTLALKRFFVNMTFGDIHQHGIANKVDAHFLIHANLFLSFPPPPHIFCVTTDKRVLFCPVRREVHQKY